MRRARKGAAGQKMFLGELIEDVQPKGGLLEFLPEPDCLLFLFANHSKTPCSTGFLHFQSDSIPI